MKMNCVSFESFIALLVEGDLNEADRRGVEKHLEECSDCSVLFVELQESQAAFKALRQGMVNAGAISEVRARVLNDVGDLDPAPAWVVVMHRLLFAGLRRRAAIATVAVGVLLLGGLWLGLTKHQMQTEVKLAAHDEPVVPVNVAAEEEFVKPVKTDKALPRPRRHRTVTEKPDNRVAAQSDSIQFPIKFVTDDPNIIIYWLPSDKGD